MVTFVFSGAVKPLESLVEARCPTLNLHEREGQVDTRCPLNKRDIIDYVG